MGRRCADTATKSIGQQAGNPRSLGSITNENIYVDRSTCLKFNHHIVHMYGFTDQNKIYKAACMDEASIN